MLAPCWHESHQASALAHILRNHENAQIPSLEEIWWVSALGTISSLGYVFISLGLGLAYCEWPPFARLC